MQYEKNRSVKGVALTSGQRFPLTIKRLGINGEGIGYFKHKVVFVPNALPAEVIVAEVVRDNPHYATAKVHKIREKSPHRVAKRDDYDVGGIELEQLAYEKQLEFKRDIMMQSLEKFKPRGYRHFILKQTLGMKVPYEYRNKAQFQVRQNERGEVVAGLYKRGTHELVALPTFSTQRPLTMKIMRIVCRLLQKYEVPIYNEQQNSGIVKTLVVRESVATGQAQLVFVTNSPKFPHKKPLLAELQQAVPQLSSVMQNINMNQDALIWGAETNLLAGQDFIVDQLGTVKFKLSARAFFQLNPSQTEVMYRKVEEALALEKGETLIDAYCGVGTIGLFVGQNASEVRGMDITPAAITDARANAQLNKRTNTRYECGKAEEVIPQWIKEGFVADALVVDPPRTGLDSELLKTIITVRPRKFVYVSCNPATLARDLKELVKVYQVEYIQPIDMFPQTARSEAIVKLTLR